MMKAISLLQPWATLVAIGAKKIETRSRYFKYTGDLLIHASNKFNKEQKDLCATEDFIHDLKRYDFFDLNHPTCGLPVGAIVGKVRMIGCNNTENIDPHFLLNINFWGVGNNIEDWFNEKMFGDYTPGRFAYYFKDNVQFKNIYHCKGSVVIPWTFSVRICKQCGCTDNNCRHCIERTGEPCHWVEADLCSACIHAKPRNHDKNKKFKNFIKDLQNAGVKTGITNMKTGKSK